MIPEIDIDLRERADSVICFNTSPVVIANCDPGVAVGYVRHDGIEKQPWVVRLEEC